MNAKVTHVLMKHGHGEPMVMQVAPALLLAKYGILGDVNAAPLSPRQVLVIDEEVLAEFGLSPGILRENIVVTGVNAAGLPSGSVLQIGDTAAVRLTFQCEICAKLTGCGVYPLRQLNGKRGTLGVVVRGGEICHNDPVTITSDRYTSVPSQLYERFLWAASRIPAGKIATYRQLLSVLGVSKSYLRIFPSFIKRAGADAPVHRVVDSNGHLRPYCPSQKERLEKEGIAIDGGMIDVSAYKWDPSGLYYTLEA